MSTPLKKFRLAHPDKFTQKAVAEGVGLTQGNYSKKENGGVPTTLEDLKRIADFYGVSTWEILKANGSDNNGNGSDNSYTKTSEQMNRIIELTDVITTLNKAIKERDNEIKRLKDQIRKRGE
jgi:transcriptional regulator with XRE-family HTH domain